MILGDMLGTAAESPASNAAGQGVTYALENHCDGNVTVGSNPTPSASDLTSNGSRCSWPRVRILTEG
jgi:hypothetical protein